MTVDQIAPLAGLAITLGVGYFGLPTAMAWISRKMLPDDIEIKKPIVRYAKADPTLLERSGQRRASADVFRKRSAVIASGGGNNAPIQGR